jgi:hypothetical protein
MAVLKSLLVTLGLNSAQYRSDLEGSRKKTKSSFSDMSKSASEFADKTKTSFTVASAAIIAASTAALNQQKELERYAQASGQTVEEFYNMAIAVQTVGTNMDQLGSILGDTEEKIGDFLNTGGGGFQDFADAMGMTKEEARATALELQKLSGRDVLVEMVRQMEEAGVSSEQMNHALEGMASEARYLLPLLTNNAEQLEKLEDRFSGLATTIDEETTKELNEMLTVSKLVVNNMNNALATALAGISDDFIKAGENVAFFWASMQKGTEQQLISDMAKVSDAIKATRRELEELDDGDAWYDFMGGSVVDDQIKRREERLEELLKQQEELKRQYNLGFGVGVNAVELPDGSFELEESKPLELTVTPKLDKKANNEIQKTFGEMYGETDQVDVYALNLSKQNAALAESLAERLDLETETLDEQHARELEMLQTGLSDYDEYLTAKANLDKKYAKAKEAAEVSSMQAVLSATESFSSALLAVMDEQSSGYKAMFLLNQASAFANAMISANLAYSQVLAHDAGILGMGAVATAEVVRGLGYASAAAIAGQTIAGVFHGGGAIPENNGEQTYLLKGGEYVESQAERRKIDDMISDGSSGMSVTVDLRGTTGDKELDRKLKASAQQAYTMVAMDFKSNGNIAKMARRN